MLIREFDPFLSEHLKQFGISGKGRPSYLSANIYNEFISILGKQVFKKKNLSELKTAKYFSVSVDSTPDYSHIDQMIFIIRIFEDDNPVKSFLEFIYITQH